MLRNTVALFAIALSGAAVCAESWTVKNPTGLNYEDEPIRLHLRVPDGPFAVKLNGASVPYQVEQVDGKPFIWVLVSMGAGESRTFTVEPGARPAAPQKVTVRREGDVWLLDNGKVAARVPAEAAGLAAPLASLRLPDGRWIGKGLWLTKLPLKKFTSTLVADGQVFAKVRLRYEFEGLAGIEGKTPAFAVVDVALNPGQRHLVIEEAHEMGREDAWEFDLCSGWDGRTPHFETFAGGAGRAKDFSVLPKDLKPLGWDRDALQTRYDRGDPRLGDTLMWLVPRANQHYQDGWMFAITGASAGVGASPCRAGRWFWPHNNKLAIQAKASADYAGVRCPTLRGRRYWHLVTGGPGEFTTQAAGQHVLRYGYKDLDKILIDYITAWEGKDQQEGFYAGQFNPLFLTRGFLREGGKGSPSGTPMDQLTAFEVALDPDMYGEYWQFWSPENPNFFSGFYNGNGLRHLPALQTHPRYEDLRRLGAMKYAEDVYHSLTLPSGAGQECPGYTVTGNRANLALCEGLPFYEDIQARMAAGTRFKRRISYPDGNLRRSNPMGDSHPNKEAGGMTPVSVPADEVKSWQTEELQGYGVVFTNNPGTPRETFLAFKSGPNRGHFHGDQLAFHYCANAQPVAVDHHCSYRPRAGQEHMHNRVAFFTDDLPFANMDGYERLIAIATSPDADVAMGQVESRRLRWVQPFPPEDWDREYPQTALDPPLVYRRTLAFVKGGPQDYFVIRDQFQAPRPLHAAYCLHVLDEAPKSTVTGPAEGGNADGGEVFRDPAADFVKAGVQPGWTLTLLKRGLFKVVAVGKDTLKTDAKIAAGSGLAYQVMKPVNSPAPRTFRAGNLLVYCAAPAEFSVLSYPWSHMNGGYEGTQGLRLQVAGDRGEFITVLYPVAPGGEVPQMSPLPGGVKVGADEIVFAGGIDSQEGVAYATVRKAGKTAVTLTGKDINLDRFQGNIGLFVPNTGYPFGEIPDWLIRQRLKPPAWYQPVLPLGYRQQ